MFFITEKSRQNLERQKECTKSSPLLSLLIKDGKKENPGNDVGRSHNKCEEREENHVNIRAIYTRKNKTRLTQDAS